MRIFVSVSLLVCFGGLVTTAGGQAGSLSSALAPPPRRTVFVPPKTLVQIGDLGIFVNRRKDRSMQIPASSPTPLSDTVRLRTEARAVVATYRSLAESQGVNQVTVLFGFPSNAIEVAGVTRPEVWGVTFVRGADGKWTEEKKPPRKVQLNVVP
jgi:hypothetical protein